MRTNIVLDEALVTGAMKASGIKTKRAVVEEALRVFLRLKQQENIRKYRGKLPWDGDLGKMRRGS